MRVPNPKPARLAASGYGVEGEDGESLHGPAPKQAIVPKISITLQTGGRSRDQE